MIPRLRGLYAITSDEICSSEETLLASVGEAIQGGARLIQYRDKRSNAKQRRDRAAALVRLCRQAGGRLIVNDDPALAAAVGADGVHLGATDAGLAEARAICGPDSILGVSCGNSLERALTGLAGGADYVAFGRFFASRTKPDAPAADLSVLRDARARIGAPICAIGGITPALAPQVIAAGADLVAAIDGVFGASDIRAAAAAYVAAFGADAAR